MSWIDVFIAPRLFASCPECPASENAAGQPETIGRHALSSTSSLSRTENGMEKTSVTDEATPAMLEHAKRMLVYCPAAKRWQHCWYCGRCTSAKKCRAWHHQRREVEFYKDCHNPYSLLLTESITNPN